MTETTEADTPLHAQLSPLELVSRHVRLMLATSRGPYRLDVSVDEGGKGTIGIAYGERAFEIELKAVLALARLAVVPLKIASAEMRLADDRCLNPAVLESSPLVEAMTAGVASPRDQFAAVNYIRALHGFEPLPDDAFTPPPRAERAPPEPRVRSRRSDPDTSKMNAKILDGRLNEVQQRVMACFKNSGQRGLTDLELEVQVGSHSSTWRSRRSELTDAGLIVDSGERRQDTDSRKKRVVWKWKG